MKQNNENTRIEELTSNAQKYRKISRIALFVVVDILIVIVSELLPLVLRFGVFTIDMVYYDLTVKYLPIDIIIAIVIIAFFKLYNRVWAYASIEELIDCFKAATVTEVIYMVYKILFSIPVARSFYPFNWMIMFMLLAGSRVSVRLIRKMQSKLDKTQAKKRVMIIGGGAAASILIKEYEKSNGKVAPICIIDDNVAKKGKLIHNVPIVGNRDYIEDAVDKYRIDEIIIAIPSATPTEMRDLVSVCQKTKARVKRLPAIASTLSSSVSSTIRDVNYEDLLGRDAVVISNPELQEFIKGKTVMVTGGGGSIGSEICRQIAANKPKQLLIVDIYENSTYELEREIQTYYPDANFQTLIASVRDYDRMDSVFEKYRPDIIYHAAAHKHVPLMEDSPNEAVKNNCLGTLNVVKLADKYRVKRFVMISTDKAVRPTNVMGATKRICEMIIQTWDRKSETEFVAVRFGNVLGSNGSVIPLFLKQIEAGGPLTLTHREITRFFMTIPEAVSLVLAAGLMASGGEIFILDMGQPVKIYDLACNLIRMKGYEPEKDIRIDIVGLRPGEKLYEELLMEEEGLQDTANSRIKVGKPMELDPEFENKLKALIAEAYVNGDGIRDSILNICPTYQPKKH